MSLPTERNLLFLQILIKYLNDMACKYYIHVNDFKNLQSNVMTSQQFFTNFSCRFFRAPGGHVFMVSVLKGYFTLVFSSDIIWLDKKNKATCVKKTFWNQKNFSWWTNKEFQKGWSCSVKVSDGEILYPGERSFIYGY